MTSTSARCALCGKVDSIDHIALRCLNPTMNGTHTNGTMLALASVLKPSAKADMAHPLLEWMPAEMRGSWSRTLKSLKTYLKLSLLGPVIGFSLTVLAPLPGTKGTLMLSLCTLSQADPHKLILLRSFLKTGTFILLNLNSAQIPTHFLTLEAATAQHTNTITRLKSRSLRNPNRNNKALPIITAPSSYQLGFNQAKG
eukprot:1138715-Pelagomonas_calceolata.AAC.1